MAGTIWYLDKRAQRTFDDNTGMYEKKFVPKILPWQTTNLIIGTSRTKHVQSSLPNTTIHSYRGVRISDLKVIQQYPPLNINTVSIIAGFIDHRNYPEDFAENYRLLIQLLIYKFNPKSIICPEIIASSRFSLINTKIFYLNQALFNVISSFNVTTVLVPSLCISNK